MGAGICASASNMARRPGASVIAARKGQATHRLHIRLNSVNFSAASPTPPRKKTSHARLGQRVNLRPSKRSGGHAGNWEATRARPRANHAPYPNAKIKSWDWDLWISGVPRTPNGASPSLIRWADVQPMAAPKRLALSSLGRQHQLVQQKPTNPSGLISGCG